MANPSRERHFFPLANWFGFRDLARLSSATIGFHSGNGARKVARVFGGWEGRGVYVD
jgi:hypothetical protein